MLDKLKLKMAGMSKEVKASVAYTICSVLQKSIAFLTMPLFTRLLTTEQYGQTTIFTSWSGIFMLFLTLNLAYGSFSPAMMKYENHRDEYIASVQGICLLLSTVFLLIYLPFHIIFDRLLDMPYYLVIVMVLEILTSTATALWSGKKRFEYDYKKIVFVTLAITVISIIFSLACVLLYDERGYAKIIGNAIIIIAFGLIIFISNTVKGKTLFNREYWKYAISFNLPLLIYFFSQIIFNQSDRLMINYMSGTDKAGIYGVAYTLATVLQFLLNAINNSYIPWFYKKIKGGEERDNKNVSMILALLVGTLVLVVIAFAPELIKFMAGRNYMGAIWIIPPVALSLVLLFYSQLFINVEFYYEKKKNLIYAAMLAAMLNIVLNAVFIPTIGYIAAGYTTLASYILFFWMNYCEMRKATKDESFDHSAFSVKGLILIFFLIAAVAFIFMAFYFSLIIRIAMIVAIAIVCAFNKNRILPILHQLKKRR